MFNHVDNEKKYSDIFKMSRPKIPPYPTISNEERAGQFSSFEALVGLDDEIDEMEEIIVNALELSEDQKQDITEKVYILNTCAEAEPVVKIVYFVSNEKKDGGIYISTVGTFKRFDEAEKLVVLKEGISISLDTMIDIDSTLFK